VFWRQFFIASHGNFEFGVFPWACDIAAFPIIISMREPVHAVLLATQFTDGFIQHFGYSTYVQAGMDTN
jgi:hypothetical protein